MKVSTYNRIIQSGEETYLFNARRRGLYRVEPHILSALALLGQGNRDWDIALSEEERTKLEFSGCVVGDSVDELKELREERFRFPDRLTGLSVTIAPTLDCNFECAYCFEGVEKPSAHMDPETISAVVRFIKNQVSREPGHRSVASVW